MSDDLKLCIMEYEKQKSHNDQELASIIESNNQEISKIQKEKDEYKRILKEQLLNEMKAAYFKSWVKS